jgi:hypothetical protein
MADIDFGALLMRGFCFVVAFSCCGFRVLPRLLLCCAPIASIRKIAHNVTCYGPTELAARVEEASGFVVEPERCDQPLPVLQSTAVESCPLSVGSASIVCDEDQLGRPPSNRRYTTQIIQSTRSESKGAFDYCFVQGKRPRLGQPKREALDTREIEP